MKVRTPVFVVSVTMFVLGAAAAIRDGSELDPQSQALRLDAELELSFLNFQADVASRQLSSEQVRMEMAGWHDRNAELIGRAEELKSQVGPEIVIENPGSPPQSVGISPEEFLTEARDYKERLAASLASELENPGDAEELRLRTAARMRAADIVALDQAMATAAWEAAESHPVVAIDPLSSEELDLLSPGERAEEEIYAAIHAATRQPLSEGEEMRDRIAPLDEWIRAKRKIHQPEEALYQQQQLAERIELLESRVAGEVSAEQTEQ